ncbi:MAG: DNA helicase RecQ [Dorea sp.]|jgi:ATP-dependent DNA helicase RecQ|nr:DNA helicase RecQ [Dorea sp.]
MNASDILKKYFGYDSFREGQEPIIQSILSGRDALAIMPTGAGKSLCYQVPALLLPGITLVISPLISLMQDQVKSLNEAGIHAAFINSSLTETQISKALDLASRGIYKIIYVAPERLESDRFMQFARNSKISMVTVDEAHCISQWGQDFRPSYLKIVEFIGRLPARPVVSAFTATATKEVKTDIECILKLDHPSVVVTGFDRENLYYSVEHVAGKKKDAFVADYIRKHPDESGIIYCATRKNVDALYEMLFRSGVPVTSYHAGIDSNVRKKNQDDFIYDRAQVVVATNAFGMGIDKSNVRFVIHYNMPQSMENYYQEAGRAGRDGENSQCILLFSAQDVMIGKFLLDNKSFEEMDEEDIELIRQRDAYRLQVMEGYCKTTSCLRNYILEYFGEKIFSPCNNCGNCHRDYTETDMTAEAKWVVNCIAETRGRYGRNIVSGTLVGANRARLKEIGATAYRSYKALEQVNEKDVQILIDQMLREGYIVQSNGEYPVLQMGDITALKKEDTRVLIRKFEEKSAPVSDRRKKARSTDSLTSAGYRLFEELRSLRTAIAKEEGLPPYIIFSDKTLIDMCAKMPENRQEMLGVSGVGENKFRKYGQRFMDVVTEFIGANPNSVVSVQLEGENAEVSGDGSEDHGGKKQTNVGMRWTDEEDERLIAEFRSGMKVAEIAKAHGRTKGAVRSRLQRHGFG